MNFSERLKELREQRQLSQEQLAEALSIPRSTIAHYESETGSLRLPRPERLQQIADFFQVSTDYLLGRTDDPTPPPKRYIPPWATKKDIRDFKKMLEEDEELMFDGVPIDDEDREIIRRLLERLFWDAKEKNKRKKPKKQ